MIEAKIEHIGNFKEFIKKSIDLSKLTGKLHNDFITNCCKALLVDSTGMRKRSFRKKVDPVTGKPWKEITVKWWIIKRALGLNPDNILRFGFRHKKGFKRSFTTDKKEIRQRYKVINSKGVLYDNLNFKVISGNGYVGTNIPYAKKHNQGKNGMPKRRFLGVGKPDLKLFSKIYIRMMKKIEKTTGGK